MKTQKDELTILKSSEGELSNQIKARFESELLSKDTKIAALISQIENNRRHIESMNSNHRKQIMELKKDKVCATMIDFKGKNHIRT